MKPKVGSSYYMKNSYSKVLEIDKCLFINDNYSTFESPNKALFILYANEYYLLTPTVESKVKNDIEDFINEQSSDGSL